MAIQPRVLYTKQNESPPTLNTQNMSLICQPMPKGVKIVTDCGTDTLYILLSNAKFVNCPFTILFQEPDFDIKGH